jgi:hypothetical protein
MRQKDNPPKARRAPKGNVSVPADPEQAFRHREPKREMSTCHRKSARLEYVCNRARLHSALGYEPQVEFEAELSQTESV